jgi:hypothetical protein
MTSSADAGSLGGGSLCGGRHEEEEGEGEEVQRVRAWLREYVPPPVARVPSPRGPMARVPSPLGSSARVLSPRGSTARVHSPRGPSARVLSPRGPSARVPSTEGPTAMVPSPRGPTARVPSPRGSKTARVPSPQGLVEEGKNVTGTPAKSGIGSGFLMPCMAIKRFVFLAQAFFNRLSLDADLWL